jgi:DNA-directed RNA polymerase subunit beta'
VKLHIESKFGEVKKYLVKLSNQILVQENDFVKAGMPLSDGAITPGRYLKNSRTICCSTVFGK